MGSGTRTHQCVKRALHSMMPSCVALLAKRSTVLLTCPLLQMPRCVGRLRRVLLAFGSPNPMLRRHSTSVVGGPAPRSRSEHVCSLAKKPLASSWHETSSKARNLAVCSQGLALIAIWSIGIQSHHGRRLAQFVQCTHLSCDVAVVAAASACSV